MRYHGGFLPTEENIIRQGSKHFFNSALPMREYQECEEQLVMMQKELACDIYIQRCLDFGK